MTDWAALMRQASREYGLRPAEFWALSVREWLALQARATDAPDFRRAELQSLMQRFSDDP